MIVEVSPSIIVAMSGEPAQLLVTIVNTEQIIGAYEVTVLGADASWITQDQQRLSLFPEGVGAVNVTVQLPTGIPAGTRKLAVQVREITAPGTIEVVEVELTVPPQHGTSIELDPTSVTGGAKATVSVILANQGNADVDVFLAGNDADQAIRFAFEPPDLVLPVGERITINADLQAKRPLTGAPKIRQFSIAARVPDAEPVAATGTFLQKPRLSRGALGLVGLLAALSVFAAVIAITFGSVVDRSQSDRDLVLDALREEAQGEGGSGTGAISGTVTLLTDGTPVPAVTVELFSAADAGVAIANAATEDDGTYALDGLGEGRFKLRFRGAGFTELWYPLSLTSDNAEELELGPGQVLDAIDIRLGGVPASIAGTVEGEDPAGATVSVRLPRDTTTPVVPSDPVATAVVATAVVDDTGAFEITELPSPSVYEVTVQLEGFATELKTINLSAGEARTGLRFSLRRGDGLISGRVSSPSGPLGGAAISASDGRTVIDTVSLTRDDVGAFTLRDMPTPATYTIIVSAPGFITQTFTVTLGVAERRDGVNATLSTDAGSIAGTVAVAGVGLAGGVRIRASGGESQVETVSLSVGAVGTYRLSGLQVPGTYTVTFERDDLASQTRSVDLDAGGRQNVRNVDATLQPATGAVFGVVTGTGFEEPVPLGEVEVTLTSGDRTFNTRTASEPLTDGEVPGLPAGTIGAYEVRGMPPGTYTVTFTRPGSTAAALLVTVSAGGRSRVDATLSAQAGISGTVFVEGGVTDPPLAGAQVRIFTADLYPVSPAQPPVFTGSDGRFSITGLDAPEVYVLDFAPVAGQPIQQSRVVTLDPGQQRDFADEPPIPPVVLTTA